MPDKPTQRRQWRKIKLVLGKEEILKDITNINQRIERIAARRPTSTQTPRKTQAAKIYARVRNHALNLHATLQEKFQPIPCPCKAIHIVSLQLQKAATDKVRNLNPVRFKVLFSFHVIAVTKKTVPWDWREMEFEPITEEATDETPITIDPSGNTMDGSVKRKYVRIRSSSTSDDEKDARKNKPTDTFSSIFKKKPSFGEPRNFRLAIGTTSKGSVAVSSVINTSQISPGK
jgi:hypothetical protein